MKVEEVCSDLSGIAGANNFGGTGVDACMCRSLVMYRSKGKHYNSEFSSPSPNKAFLVTLYNFKVFHICLLLH